MKAESFDYTNIFRRIPSVTGLDWVWKGNNWLGNFYMDGKKHSKIDKTVCYMANGKIFLHENGSTSMSLWDWLLWSGRCKDNSDVADVFMGYGSITKYDHYEIPRFPSEIIYVDDSYVATLEKRYFGDLFTFLSSHFDPKRVREVWREYRVGVIYDLAIFWYIDSDGNICHDSRIKYKPDGHRNKDFVPYRKFKKDDGFLKQCLFGDHLPKNKTIVVESEKTALIGAIKYPAFRWCATGGMSKLNDILPDDCLLAPDYHPDAIKLWAKHGEIWPWWEGSESVLKNNNDVGDLILLKQNDSKLA